MFRLDYWGSVALLAWVCPFSTHSFGVPTRPRTRHVSSSPSFSTPQRSLSSRPRSTRLHNADSNEPDRMAELRSLLEASWNEETMGEIPTSPVAAAQAIQQEMSSESGNLQVVDLQLPSLDRRQGERWFDAVLLADLAQLLARQFNDPDKCLLLVPDESMVTTIQRVWDSRDEVVSVLDDAEEDEDDEDEDDEGQKDDDSATIEYDDFADFGSLDSFAEMPVDEPFAEEYDDFADFGSVDSLAPADGNEGNKEESPEPQEVPAVKAKLLSMFGDATISNGPDCESNVLDALKTRLDELKAADMLMVLCPMSKAEISAVRILAGSYPDKRILLLNPALLSRPRPLELQSAKMTYSLRPFLVRSKGSQETVIRIVVLYRRGQWQVFVSPGDDPETSEATPMTRLDNITFPESMDPLEGPPMQWVAACAQQYLEAQSSQGKRPSP